MRAFIRRNRAEIDKIILGLCPNIKRLNDRDREMWILNDVVLYRWARCEGVKI